MNLNLLFRAISSQGNVPIALAEIPAHGLAHRFESFVGHLSIQGLFQYFRPSAVRYPA